METTQQTLVQEEDEELQSAKRKKEVLEFLKGDSQEKKYKRKKKPDRQVTEQSIAAESVPETEGESLKKRRVALFEALIESFDVGDLDLMAEQLHGRCMDDVIISCELLGEEAKGISSILLFWGLMREMYPDAIIKILDTRICTNLSAVVKKIADESSPMNKIKTKELTNSKVSSDAISVQFLLKITGTRITDKPLSFYFKKIQTIEKIDDMSSEQLTNTIAKYVAEVNNHQSGSDASVVKENATEENTVQTWNASCNSIVESTLLFDKHDRIAKWIYETLASDDHIAE